MALRLSRRAALLGAAALTLAAAGSAQAVTIFGLTVQGQLIRFDSATPGTVTTVGNVSGASGVVGDWRGIDFRPSTSGLYLLQGAQGGNPDRFYTVNTTTAAATLATGFSTNIAGSGAIGFDFNPAVDLARVVTSAAGNFRVNPTTGVVQTDTAATITPGGATPFITGSAYTNGGIGAAAPASTRLYNIDSRNSSLYFQEPANNGTNTLVGALGIDMTGVDASFDIYFNGTNQAFMAANLNNATSSTLYSINLATGAATSLGVIGGGVALRDIAAIPAPGAMGLAALGLMIGARRRR